MVRLPQPGSDSGTWGDILNEYLSQVHKSDGSLKNAIIDAPQLKPNAVTNDAIAPGTITTTEIADESIDLTKLATTGSASGTTYLRGVAHGQHLLVPVPALAMLSMTPLLSLEVTLISIPIQLVMRRQLI